MTVVQFVQKLLNILQNEPETVKWISNGTEFEIIDLTSFTHKILPAYFRHRKFESFIRQLNMYGFHKVNRRKNSQIFQHQHFVQNQECNYGLIKRTKKVKTESKCKNNSMVSVKIDTEILDQRAPKMAELLTKLIQFDTKNQFDSRMLKTKLDLLSRQVSTKKERNLRPIIKSIREKINVLEEINKKMLSLNWETLTNCNNQASPAKSNNQHTEDYEEAKRIMSAPVFGSKAPQENRHDGISLNQLHSFGSISSFIAFN